MKLFLSLLALASFPAFAEESCLKPGARVSAYGAIDMIHFFHAGNGMHVASLTIRTDKRFCVEEGYPEGKEFVSFQILTDGLRTKLSDGMLVDLEGTYAGFGDTAWYSSFPLLKDVKIKKIYKTDPREVR